MKVISRIRAGLFGALIALSFIPLSAQADFCASGSSCDIHLTNTNNIGVTVDVLVNINNTGSQTILTVSYLSSNVLNAALGIDQFGLGTSILGTPSGWNNGNCPAQGCQMDGFGRFAREVDKPGGTDLSFSFTLSSLVTTFANNASGGSFAGHIRFDGCSGFFSNGTSTGPTTTSCTIGQQNQAPEPGTLALLGIALLAATLYRRRQRET